jgi:hypothetical protein
MTKYVSASPKRTSIFAHLATIAAYAIFPSWTVLLEVLTTLPITPEFMKIRKIEMTPGPELAFFLLLWAV